MILIPKFDNIIVVGGMANNILSYKGNSIGKSIKEEKTSLSRKDLFICNEISHKLKEKGLFFSFASERPTLRSSTHNMSITTS